MMAWVETIKHEVNCISISNIMGVLAKCSHPRPQPTIACRSLTVIATVIFVCLL